MNAALQKQLFTIDSLSLRSIPAFLVFLTHTTAVGNTADVVYEPVHHLIFSLPVPKAEKY